MEQHDKSETLKNFRNHATKFLITTDLLGRGIDVQHVEMVINYDMPGQRENYIHRIGRAGRYGKKGKAINFVLPKDVKFVDYLKHYYDCDISEIPDTLDEL